MGFAVIREVPRLAETSTLAAAVAQRQRLRLAVRRDERAEDGGHAEAARAPAVLGRRARYADGRRWQSAVDPSRDPGATFGVDLKYAVTPGLTLTATLNPDFGQVEADPAVVNLDAFETFFHERRPFFVEGSGTFRFNMDCNDGDCTGPVLFAPDRPRAAGIARTPLMASTRRRRSSATILGAGKLTGRLGGFSLGALTAVTAREDAEIAGLNSIGRRDQTVEPLTGYTVLRARKEFANQSSLGFMTTSTNRQNEVATSFLANNAFAGGLDYDWRLSQKYSVSGFWAGSMIKRQHRGDHAAAGKHRPLLPAARRRLPRR